MPKGKRKYSYYSHGCLFCSKVVCDRKTLEYHIRAHTGEKPNFCKTCSYEGVSDIYMRKHEESVCQKVFTCAHCGSTFRSRQDLSQHRSFHCNKLPFKCNFCPKAFTIQAGLTLHGRIHKDTGLILTPRQRRTCTFCNKFHVNVESLNAHVLQHIGERPFSCSHCDYSATTENLLKKHQVVHITDKCVKCPSCEKMFATKQHLQMHQKRHHDKPKVSLSCSMCNYTTYHMSDLKPHLRSHTNEKHFKCDICEKELTTKSSLRRHRLIHFPDHKKIYSCSICDKTFKYSTGLHTHKKIHSELRLYPCKLCPKILKTKGSLRAHTNIHTRGIIVKCRACPVTLASRAERHEHELKYHDAENPQMLCDICHRTFGKFDFEDHINSHNKLRRHSCVFCKNSFQRPGELDYHIRGHIREFPTWCYDCGLEFKRDRPHIIKKHKCSKR